MPLVRLIFTFALLGSIALGKDSPALPKPHQVDKPEMIKFIKPDPKALLGIVVDDVIECPLHQGRFCVRTGRALSPPVSSPITSYPTKVEDGMVYVQVMGAESS